MAHTFDSGSAGDTASEIARHAGSGGFRVAGWLVGWLVCWLVAAEQSDSHGVRRDELSRETREKRSNYNNNN